MVDLVLSFLACACLAVPITFALGIFYFSVAIGVIDTFRLNYGVKPVGFAILNWAFGITFLSYFIVFVALFRRC
jgi:hypothetical protein